MTFWDFYDAHPFVGLAFSLAAVYGACSAFTRAVDAVAGVFRTKYGGCDCEPCECPPGCHDATDDDASPSEGNGDG